MALFNLQFYAPAVQTFMPSENLQTHWFYTSYIPLQRTWVHPEKRKPKISRRSARNIRNVWREKEKKKEKLHPKLDPRLISRLVNISILGVWGCKKSCSNARAIVGQLGNHGGWCLFTEQVCKSCFYTTAELLVMFIEPTIQSNDGPRHFTAIAWYFVPAYLLQDAIYASSG